MSDRTDRQTLRLLGGLTFALGFLAACDAAYEIYETGFDRPAVGFEFLLGQAAIMSGLAQLQRRRQALEIAVLAAAAAFCHSAVALIQVGPHLLKALTILGAAEDPRLWSEYGLRLIVMTTQVLFWPILLGLLYIDLQCRSSEDPKIRRAKRAFWTCAGAAVLLSVMIEFMLHR